MRGRDIKRYGYDWAGLWLVYIPWHFPLHKDTSIQGASEKAEQAFKKWYPAIYQHLSQYKKQLSARNMAETGIRYEWYAMQRWGANYSDDFNKPKIVYMEIQTDNEDEGYPFPCFSFDESNAVIMNTGYIMTSESIDVRYILGVLNSKLGKILTKMYVSQLQKRQFRMLSQFVSNFPIVVPKDTDILQISKLTRERLETQNIEIESTINSIVYRLYQLDNEEIDFIESNVR